MIPSSADATAAARRIQEPYGQSYARHMDDARLLAGFVLAGDTERPSAPDPAKPVEHLKPIADFLAAVPEADGVRSDGHVVLREETYNALVADTERHPKVRGRCPRGCGETLFLGSGGYVTCSLLGCSEPCAASDLLAEGGV